MRRTRTIAVLALAGVVAALRPARADESMAPYSVADTTAARVALDRARVAFAAGEPSRAFDELQHVLDSMRDDVVALPPPEGTDEGPTPPTRYIPATRAALDMLLALPEKDRAAYEDKAGPAAKALLERAEARRDEGMLREVVERYAATASGRVAARRLVESSFEGGRPRDAAAAAADALRLLPLDTGIWTRRIDALAAAGDGAGLAALSLPPEIETAPAAVVPPEGATKPPSLAERLAAARTKVPPPPPPADVPAWGGDATHDAAAPWDLPLRPLRWVAGAPPRERQNDSGSADYRQEPRDQQLFGVRLAALAPYFPIVVDRSILVADGFSVESRDLLSSRLSWRFPRPRAPGSGDRTTRTVPREQAPDAVESAGAALLGRTNLDVAHTLCAADGAVFATLEVVDKGFYARFLHGIPITTYRPRRVLFALDAATGEPRWRMGVTPADEKALEGISIGGGPVVADGIVVVPGVRFEKRWQSSLLAFDAKSGRLRWSRDIVTSQQELNLFGEPIKELWAGTPAVADGVVYASTGLGVFVALDLRTGAVRWMSSYDTIEISRVQVWFDTPLRFARWGPSPAIVHGDVVLVAPSDGPSLLCFERADGTLRWRESAESRPEAQNDALHYVDQFLGVANDGKRDVAISTGRRLVARDLADGNPVWSADLSSGAIVRGRGAISKTRVYVATTAGLDVFSLAGEGRLLAPSPAPWSDRAQPGNILLTPRVLIVSGGMHMSENDIADLDQPIEAFYDPDDIEREIEQRRRASPADPRPLLELADLWRLVGREQKAEGGYEDARRAAEAAKDPATADHAREGLLLLARDRGDAFRGLHKVPDARSAYEAGLSKAKTAAERVMLRLRIEALLHDEPGLENARIKNLSALAEEAGDERAMFSPREGDVPVRAKARLVLAAIHLEAGRAADAVDTLEDVLKEDAAAVVADQPAGVAAKRKIDEILADKGPGPYRRHEQEAARLLEEASKSNDPAPFERILADYPNARSVPSALLGLAERQLAAGAAAGATSTLERFLGAYPEHGRAPRALALLARTLKASGSLDRARAAIDALERRHGAASFEIDGRETTGKAFAEAERARLPATPPRPAAPPLSKSPQERLTETVDSEQLGARCVEVDGAASAPFSVPSLVVVEHQVIAIDPESARVRWRRTIEGASRGAHAAVAGATLVIGAGDTVLGLDPQSGDVRWEHPLPPSCNAMDVGASLGLAVVLVQYASVTPRSSLVAVDALTGAPTWTTDLTGGPALRLLAGDDGVAIVRRRLDASGSYTVSIHAGLTGELLGDLPRGFDGFCEGSPRLEKGRLLVGVTRDGEGLRLDGVELSTGKPSWSTPLTSPGPRPHLRRQLHVRGPNALVLEETGSVRTFALDGGTPVAETAVTGGLLFAGERSIVVLDDRFVALLRDPRGRYVVGAFDRRTGRSLWTGEAVKDAPGVFQGFLFDGGSVVVAVVTPARPTRVGFDTSNPPDYQIAVFSPEDGNDVRITANGLGEFRPSACLSDGLLVVAGRRRFAVYR